MGQTIEKQALAAGHEVVLKITIDNQEDLTAENLRRADVAIEFTTPESAFDNISLCLRSGVPVVCGTTGWLNRLDEVKKLCHETGGAFFHSANFSIGVNLFFAVNRYLAALMNNHSEYEPTLEEIHHTQKLDAPSGTAIALAQGILDNLSRKKKWVNELAISSPPLDIGVGDLMVENGQASTLENSSAQAKNQAGSGKKVKHNKAGEEDLLIVSKRIETVPGTHTVAWVSENDTIEIKHTAHSREGFAAGALAAAVWLVGKKGCFEMKDLLQI